MEFIVDHAEARFAVVEDQEQVDKLLQVKARCPRLEHIVYDDARGLRHYKDAGPHQPGGRPGARPAVRSRAPGLLRAGGGQGHGGRRRDHLLHVGHDGPAEGDDAVPPEPDRHRPERHRVRGSPRDRRGRGLSPDGVDRRPHVLVRAVDPDRVHDQLPGELGDGAAGPPGDRPDVLLRAAGHLPAHPDGGHDPDRGLRRRPSAAWSGSSWTWPGGWSGGGWPASRCRRRPPPPRPGPGAGLRSAAGQPRDEPGPPRLHRRGGDRAGAVRVLSRARGQHEAAVRHDRVERPDLHPAGRGGPARHRGHPADGCRGPDRRVGRGALPEPRGLRRLLQEPGGDPADDRGRLGALRGRRHHRQGRAPPHHRPRAGRGAPRRRDAVRAEVPREQAEVLALHPGGGLHRPGAGRSSPRSSTST